MKKWYLFVIFFTNIIYANPLPQDEAFKIQTKILDPNTLMVAWQIAPGYFLYAERIKWKNLAEKDILLDASRIPKPGEKIDSQGNLIKIYHNEVLFPVNVLALSAGEKIIKVDFQGCSDSGFCYPPETRQIKITIDKNLALSKVEILKQIDDKNRINNSKKIVTNFNYHTLWVVLSFFGFGLLLSFTPCILPMLPVLSGILVGFGNNISTRKALIISASYVISMAFSYALIGAFFAALGQNLQIIMQSPWVLASFSLVFVFLALAMFGVYDLQLPLSWQNKLIAIRVRSNNYCQMHKNLDEIDKNNCSSQASTKSIKWQVLSAFVMGSLATLILSPCVTAPMVGAISYITQDGNIFLGSLALFFLGLGLGTPLLIIGTSAGKWLPKSGKWMHVIKIFLV